ncbi:MAG: DUF4251 domain-containing protein [Muribaculum sp.]|nr:DUF4251 domain-containing protein [Muribaculaceae bacterium]MCM1081738.1 DUF4251 domain-containing protein [Muribaculum sp.]
MNKIFKKMMSVLVVASVICMMVLAGCSTTKELTPEQKARKELQARADSLRAEVAAQAVMSGHFIAGADQITLRRGRTFNVNSNLNYVSLNGTDAVLQVGSTSGWPGFNGIGGITLKGTATDLQTSVDKKGNLNFSMRVSGSGMSAEVRLQMTKGTDKAFVQIKGTFSYYGLTMYTTVEPFDGVGAVEGRSL